MSVQLFLCYRSYIIVCSRYDIIIMIERTHEIKGEQWKIFSSITHLLPDVDITQVENIVYFEIKTSVVVSHRLIILLTMNGEQNTSIK